MHPVRRRRMMIVIVSSLSLSLVIALVLFALRQNINLFYTPTDIYEESVSVGKEIRLGGMVEKGSLVRDSQNLSVQFRLSDTKHQIVIQFQGILPDLFREGQGIVTKGKLLPNGMFQASQVLAKHDENYMPPALKQRLEKQKNSSRGEV